MQPATGSMASTSADAADGTSNAGSGVHDVVDGVGGAACGVGAHASGAAKSSVAAGRSGTCYVFHCAGARYVNQALPELDALLEMHGVDPATAYDRSVRRCVWMVWQPQRLTPWPL